MRALGEALEPRTLLSAALVKDSNTVTLSSTPGSWVELGDSVLFTAVGEKGRELYITDGSSAGTQLLIDINPNTSSTGGPVELTRSGSVVMFYADDGVHGYEPWITDGSAAGTYMVADINPGSGSSKQAGVTGGGSLPSYVTAVGNTFFFAATDGTSGVELWRSDGTETGTAMVADILAGPGSSSPSALRNVNGTLMFAALNSANGRELWSVNNGVASMVSDILPGSTSSIVSYVPAVLGNYIYFAANDGVHGQELWRSDGTSAGTEMVIDLYGSMTSFEPQLITAVGNRIFFAGYTSPGGYALHVTNGTAAGTTFIRDFDPNANSQKITNLVDFNGTLMFTATQADTGTELWRSDGTVAGTYLVKDVRAGSDSSSPQSLTVVDDVLYFGAFELLSPGGTANATDLWKSDGTPQGTTFVRRFMISGTSGTLGLPAAIDGRLYFSAQEPALGLEPWTSDGTAEGTTLLRDINTATGSSTPTPVASGGKVYFAITTPEHGRELWVSDGTESGTHLLVDLYAGTFSSSPTNLTDVNGTLYFTASVAPYGRELYKTDGTAAGTVLVKDIRPGTGDSMTGTGTFAAGTGNVMYFVADDGVHGSELWKTDGTAAGTTMIADVAPGVGGSAAGIQRLTPVANDVYYLANIAQAGITLWRTSAAGVTTQITNFSGTATGLINVAGTLFITTNAGLYKTGGTNATTVQIMGDFTIPFTWTAAVGSTLFFTAMGVPSSIGHEIYRVSAGSTTATLLKDINPAGNGNITLMTPVGDKLFFLANDGTNASMEEAIWMSDGTTGGTVLVKKLSGGTTKVAISFIKAMGDKLYFRAAHNTTGSELWVTDGTDGGTYMVSDINPGSGSSAPTNGAVIGQTMLFAATTAHHGTELFRFGPAAELQPDGTVLIRGTIGIDDIDIHGDGFGGWVVNVNSDNFAFTDAQVDGFRIAGGGGGDEIEIYSASVDVPADLNADTFGANVTVGPGGNVTFFTSQHLGALRLEGGQARMSFGTPKLLVTRELLLSGGGEIDMAQSTAIIDYDAASPIGGWTGSAYDGLLGEIARGRAASNGVFSTAALGSSGLKYLGIAEASEVLSLGAGQTETFAGETVDATTVIIKFTYAGDIDLNGEVNGDDYFRLDSNILQSGSIFGPWVGDVNLDGVIDGDDYFVLDSNVTGQGDSLSDRS